MNQSTATTEKLLWAAMTISIFVLVYVVHTVPPRGGESTLGDSLPMMALIQAAISFMIFRFRNSEKAIESALTKTRNIQKAMGVLLPLLLLSLASNESIAIIGFVLAQATGTPSSMYPYAAGALLLNLIMFPKSEAMAAKMDWLVKAGKVSVE